MSATLTQTESERNPVSPPANPLVSVIIPAYQVAPFIRETLDSVFGQTFSNYEIIVVNDGSPDSEELEKQIEAYTHLITYIQQPNQGAGAARNAGLRMARGEFVAFLDGDDLWLPEFLAEQLALINGDGGFDLVYADARNLHGATLKRITNMDVNPSAGPVTVESLISGRCSVITSSVVAKRRCILEAGLFDETFPNSQDFDLWLRLAKQGARLNYQTKVLVHRRIYDGSLASNPVKSFEGEIKVLEKTAKRDDLTDDERSAIFRTIKLRRATAEVVRGKQRLAAGDYKSALAAFRIANRHYHSWKLRLVLFSLHIAPWLVRRVHRSFENRWMVMKESLANQEGAEDERDAYFLTDHLQADLGGRTARGGAVTLVSQGLKFLIGMVGGILLARLLTPQDYGLVGMVAIVINFVSMFQYFGLSTATIQWGKLTHRQVSTLFWVNLALSIAITLVTVASAPLLAWFYNEPRLLWLTIAYAFTITLSGLGIQHEAILSRQMRFTALAVIEISSILIGLLSGLVAVWYGAGYWALVLNTSAMFATIVVGSWAACKWRPGLPARGSGVRSMLMYGGNLTGFNITSFFARNLDNALIGKFWGPTQLGLYGKAYQLLLLPMQHINAPFAAVAVPALSRLVDSPERYRNAYFNILGKIAMITMPLVVFMVGTSDWLVLFLLGPQWHQTARIFMILGIAAFIQPVTKTCWWLFSTQGRTKDLFHWGLIGGAIAIVSIIVGLPWGAVGVAASYAITDLCLTTPVLFWYVGRDGPIRTGDFYRTIVPPVCASLCALVALFLCRPWLQLFQYLLIRLGLSFGIVVGVSVLVLLMIPTGRKALQSHADMLFLLLKKKNPSVDVASVVGEG